MSLGDRLEDLLKRVSGSSGIAIVGADGIIVEGRTNDSELDLQATGAEFGALLKGAERAAASVGSALSELSMLCEDRVFFLKKISAGYFLILILSSEKDLGKGRFLLRRALSGLIKEMA
jgi:predicted regulator of Ras-like GTPase activity (Roadblock/LC7/MglB family)